MKGWQNATQRVCCNRPESEDTCEGLYAAGDVCIKPLRQVVTAVGDGALAATELERYAAALQKKTGLYPVQPAAILKEAAAAPENGRQTDGLFTPDMLSQLEAVVSKMASPLRLKLYLDDTPLSAELKIYGGALRPDG